MSDRPVHDAGRQAQETQQIYRQQRETARVQAQTQAAADRARVQQHYEQQRAAPQ